MDKQRIKRFILEVGENIYKAVQMGWFPYFVLLLLLTSPIYGQSSERTQKQAKVIEQRTQSTQRYTPHNNQNNNWNRTPNRRVQRIYQPYYYNPMVWGYTPYWNPYRSWDGREYIITTDNSKTSPQPPMRASIGVLSEVTTQQPTVSPYLIIGGKSFLIFQYHIGGSNSYPHYDNIYQWEVDEWEDEPMGNPTQRKEFVIGLGTSYGRLSPFVGFGFGRETQWDAYKDETYTLSSIRDLGIYTINEDRNPSNSIKVGTLYGWDRWELMAQLSVPYGSYNSGLRFGLGIGLKL
jgi:hypothetical protein